MFEIIHIEVQTPRKKVITVCSSDCQFTAERDSHGGFQYCILGFAQKEQRKIRVSHSRFPSIKLYDWTLAPGKSCPGPGNYKLTQINEENDGKEK